MEETLIKASLVLGGMIVVLAGVLAVVRRFTGAKVTASGGAGQFRVLDRMSLSPKHTIYLVLVAKKILIVGTADSAISLLCEISDEKEVSEILINKFGAPKVGEVIEKSMSGAQLTHTSSHTTSSTLSQDELSFGAFLKSMTKK